MTSSTTTTSTTTTSTTTTTTTTTTTEWHVNTEITTLEPDWKGFYHLNIFKN